MPVADKILVDRRIGYNHRLFVVTVNGAPMGPNEIEIDADARIADINQTVAILRKAGMSDEAIIDHIRLVRVVHVAKGGW